MLGEDNANHIHYPSVSVPAVSVTAFCLLLKNKFVDVAFVVLGHAFIEAIQLRVQDGPRFPGATAWA